MSFNDLERGSNSSPRQPRSDGRLPLYQAPPSAPRQSNQNQNQNRQSNQNSNNNIDNSGTESSKEFKKLTDSLAIQIFKINSNVSGIEKLIGLNGNANGNGSGTDSGDWSKQLADLTEVTRSLVKSSTTEIKAISNLVTSSSSSNSSQQTKQREKLAASKLQRDFESALSSFQRVQKKGAEKSRDKLVDEKERERKLRNKAASEEGGKGSIGKSFGRKKANQDDLEAQSSTPLVDVSSRPNSSAFPEGDQQQQQVQEQVQVSKGPTQAELEFQEALIAEREAEIREIEGGIHELNEIFRDLGQIVQEQGGMIDNIEYNVTSIATNTQAADRELVSASDYQRKAGKRAACLMLVVGFVIAVVLLALLN